jgi:hypothetical protein
MSSGASGGGDRDAGYDVLRAAPARHGLEFSGERT